MAPVCSLVSGCNAVNYTQMQVCEPDFNYLLTSFRGQFLTAQPRGEKNELFEYNRRIMQLTFTLENMQCVDPSFGKTGQGTRQNDIYCLDENFQVVGIIPQWPFVGRPKFVALEGHATVNGDFISRYLMLCCVTSLLGHKTVMLLFSMWLRGKKGRYRCHLFDKSCL